MSYVFVKPGVYGPGPMPEILCKVCGHNDFFHTDPGTACKNELPDHPCWVGCKRMVFPRRYYKRFTGPLISPLSLVEELMNYNP